MASLQRRRLEQATVQERQAAERPRGGGALGDGAVQDAEAQGMQGDAVEVAARRQRAVEQMRQVAAVAVEPPLLLHEIEEEHARERGERQRVPVRAAARCGEAIGEALEHGAEGPEEARRDRFSAEGLADPQTQRQRGFVRRGGEPLQEGEVGRGGVRRGERGAADRGPASARAPGGEHEAERHSAESEDEPPLYAGGEPRGRDARRARGVVGVEGEDPERAGAADQRRPAHAGRLGGRPQPGPGRHGFPRRVVAEHADHLAEIVNLLGAGEKRPQHHGPLGCRGAHDAA